MESVFCFPLVAQASSVTLQILGSGGPNAMSGLTSSGYLVLIYEKSGQLFWHASPGKIGQVALKAQPKLLVLSHFMDLNLNDKSDSLDKAQPSYEGPIILANDVVKISL